MDEQNIVGMDNNQKSVQTDTVQASENTSNVAGLTEMLGKAAEDNAQESTDATSQDAAESSTTAEQPKLSGGIKGRLLEAEKKGEKKGYDAGRQAAEQEYQARMAEMQTRLDKLSEYELKEEAAKLAKEEGCSVALAERILRAEKGLSPASKETTQSNDTKATQPRDANGRFVKNDSADTDKPDMTARAQFLFEQAQSIKRRTGFDAMELYSKADSDTQRRIAEGEIDFEDLIASQGTAKRSTPPVVKAKDGMGSTRLSQMSASDFSKLDDYVKKGGVIDLRR